MAGSSNCQTLLTHVKPAADCAQLIKVIFVDLDPMPRQRSEHAGDVIELLGFFAAGPVEEETQTILYRFDGDDSGKGLQALQIATAVDQGGQEGAEEPIVAMIEAGRSGRKSNSASKSLPASRSR